jgi:hypothetical protein
VYLGGQFATSGFGLTVRNLAAGTYQLVVFAHSTVTGTFNNVRTVTVTVTVPAPRMAIDGPAAGSTVGTSFLVAGWALEPAATSGSGVDAVHVWAYPTSGAAPTFFGVAMIGIPRPDVAAYFGAPGAASGYGVIGTLRPGTYDLVVYAHSALAGTFNNAQIVRVTVR